MQESAVAVRVDVDLGTVDIVVTGVWTWQVRVDLMTAVRKAFAQRPRAVLLDLTDLVDFDHAVVAAVLMAERQGAGLEPPVPVTVVGSESHRLRLRLAGVAARTVLHSSRTEAQADLARGTPPFGLARLRLQPGVLAPAAARNHVTDACLSWNFGQLLYRARRVVSELATNAVEHARTPFTVTVTRRCTDLLHLAVEDAVPKLPRLTVWSKDVDAPLALRGSGLRVVAATATAWGSAYTANGKVVWATLRGKAQ